MLAAVPDWHEVDGRPEQFFPVEDLAFDRSVLAPAIGPPVVRHETRRPERIWDLAIGTHAGRLRSEPRGVAAVHRPRPRGSEIRIRHAEVLEDGELGVRPLRDAQATDRFVLSGEVDFFEPTKTFHGFRYAEVTGWPGAITPTISRRWSCTPT